MRLFPKKFFQFITGGSSIGLGMDMGSQTETMSSISGTTTLSEGTQTETMSHSEQSTILTGTQTESMSIASSTTSMATGTQTEHQDFDSTMTRAMGTQTETMTHTEVGTIAIGTQTETMAGGPGGVSGSLLDSSGNGHNGTEIGADGTYTNPSVVGAGFSISRNQTLSSQGVDCGIMPDVTAFTIRGWYKPSSITSTTRIGLVTTGSSNTIGPPIDLFVFTGGQVQIACTNLAGSARTIVNSSTTNLVVGTVHHIEADWDGANLYLFIDGVRFGPTAMTTIALMGSNHFRLFNDSGLARGALGDMDEWEFKNVATHTTAFTVPTVPYSPVANTIGLWHMETSASLLNITAVGSTPSGTQTESMSFNSTTTLGTGSQTEIMGHTELSTIDIGNQTETMGASSTGSATYPQGSQTETMGHTEDSTILTGTQTESMTHTEVSTIAIGVQTETMAHTDVATTPLGTQTESMGFDSALTLSHGTQTESFVSSASAELSQYTSTTTPVTPNTPAWTSTGNAVGAINGTEAEVISPTGIDTSQDATLRCFGIIGPSTPSGFTRTAIGIRVVHRWDLTITGAVAGVLDVTMEIVLRDTGASAIAVLKTMLASGGAGTQGSLLTENFDITSLVSDAQLAAGLTVDFRVFTTGAFTSTVNGNYSWQVDACHLTASYTRTGIS